MKNLLRIFVVLCLFLACQSLLAYSFPGNPIGYVTDFANILSDDTELSLESRLESFAKETSIEIAVVTVNSLDGDSIENYANELFREWGVGKKEYNNGILFLVAPNERKVRIEVGYGLEGAMPDIQAGYIIDNIVVPAFKNGNYDSGVVEGVDATISVVQGEQFETKVNILDLLNNDGFVFFAVFFFILLGQGLLALLASTRSWWLGGVFGVIAGFIIPPLFYSPDVEWVLVLVLGIFGLALDYYVSKSYKKYKNRGGKKSPWQWGSGGGFGGGSSGGGFGGGSSGGGGASGGW